MVMKNNLLRFASLLALFVFPSLVARADDAADYKQFAEETKAWVYSLDLPAFDVREIPEKYKNESAVYIAVYDGMTVLRNTEPGRMPGTLRFARDKHIEGGDLQRMLVYINDKSALERFSEFDFATSITRKYGASHRKYRFAMGVKVIKPDGREIVIDTDEYVEVKEGKKDKDSRRKLAVPGLEVGDIIDYYLYVSHDIHNAHLDPMMIILREDYPVMDYSVSLLLDGTLCSSYRLLNGAPDLTGWRDSEGNFHLEMKIQDIPARPRLYYSDILQSPAVKLFVYNRDAEQFTPRSSSTIGVMPEPSPFFIKNEWWDMRKKLYYDDAGKDMLKESLKNVGNAPKMLDRALKSGQRTVEEVSDCAYNLLAFSYYVSDRGFSPLVFDIQLQSLLKGFVGDSLMAVMTTAGYNEPIDLVASLFDISTGCVLPGDTRYYLPPRSILSPSEIHPYYSGRISQQLTSEKLKSEYPGGDTCFIALPEGKAVRNRKYSKMTVDIDGSTLVVNRNVSCSGIAKLGQLSLLNDEDIVKAYLEYFRGFGLDVAIKENGKKAADRKARYADARISQSSDFESEVRDYHGDVVVDSVKGSIISVGIDPKAPKFVYEVGYNARDLARKAGKNMLLSVGKLCQHQSELLESDRTRTDDVVTDGAREYLTRIEINLPQGYTVSDASLEKLTRLIRNKAGFFGVTARADSGVLTLDIMKRYDWRFLSADMWPDMVALIDAASDWQAATVLLEKEG